MRRGFQRRLQPFARMGPWSLACAGQKQAPTTALTITAASRSPFRIDEKSMARSSSWDRNYVIHDKVGGPALINLSESSSASQELSEALPSAPCGAGDSQSDDHIWALSRALCQKLAKPQLVQRFGFTSRKNTSPHLLKTLEVRLAASRCAFLTRVF
jgi:hypothetical protein